MRKKSTNRAVMSAQGHRLMSGRPQYWCLLWAVWVTGGIINDDQLQLPQKQTLLSGWYI